MKKKKPENTFSTVGTVTKSNSKMVKRGNIDHSNTPIHDHTLSGLATCTSITSGGVKLVIRVQTSPLSHMMLSCKCFLYVGTMPITIYNGAKSFVLNNAIILIIWKDLGKLSSIPLKP